MGQSLPMSPGFGSVSGSPRTGTPRIVDHAPSPLGTPHSLISPTMKLTLHHPDALTKDDINVSAPGQSILDVHTTHNATVSILPSSLPAYHKAFMRGGPSAAAALNVNSPSNTSTPNRRLKSSLSPRATSSGAIRPDPLTPIQQPGSIKKQRPTKWQFGIRSRNQPLDAIACIYRALRKLGAEWLVESNTQYASGDENNEKERGRSSGDKDSNSDDPDFPEDPWVIHSRWRKDGYNYRAKRPSSAQSNFSSRHESDTMAAAEEDDDGAYVYMEIQLYQLESNFYLVDFKCAGYERVDTEGRPIGIPSEVKDVVDALDADGEVNVETMAKSKNYSSDKGQDEKDVSRYVVFCFCSQEQYYTHD